MEMLQCHLSLSHSCTEYGVLLTAIASCTDTRLPPPRNPRTHTNQHATRMEIRNHISVASVYHDIQLGLQLPILYFVALLTCIPRSLQLGTNQPVENTPATSHGANLPPPNLISPKNRASRKKKSYHPWITNSLR